MPSRSTTPGSPPTRGPDHGDPPAPLRWAVRLVAAEAVVAGLVVVFLGYQGIAGEPANRGDAFAVAGYAAVVTAALAGLAYALARRKARARAPAIVLQLLAVMATVIMISAGLYLLAAPMAVLGIAVTTLLVAPSTTDALTG